MLDASRALLPIVNCLLIIQITLLRNYSAQHLLICCAYRSKGAPDANMVYMTTDTVLTRDARDVHDVK
jgi:hypothetical protein